VVLAIISGTRKFWVSAAFILAIDALYIYTTRRGKFVAWARLLGQLNLRGDERILDLGCGRGAVLLLAAQHLTTGRAVGVDLWRRVDQSGNSSKRPGANAIAEGVDDRVELHTANMMALPFEDDSFDLVVSNLRSTTSAGRAGREKAVSEAVRVLRPGGRLLIVTCEATRHHRAQLAGMGMTEVARRRLGWRLMAPLVTATKPQRQS